MLVGNKDYKTVWMENNIVKMINQPLLPHKFEIFESDNYKKTADAISTMVVRGAGALAIAGAYGMVQVFMEEDTEEGINKGYEILKNTRPTAVNLFYAIDNVLHAGLKGKNKEEKIKLALEKAEFLSEEDSKMASAIGDYGEALIKDGDKILTHCNAGWLAFVDWGTAIAPIYKAKNNGKNIFVWVDETRPRMQGARLTAWELAENNIPHKIIADSSAAFLMKNKEVDIIITGADRIAANGDTANKIGTFDRAILAQYFNIPFYIAAPTTTIDFNISDGSQIPIEMRSDEEVLYTMGYNEELKKVTKVRTAPLKSPGLNPAFDVTPADLITGFITEKGVFKPNEIKGLK